MFVIWVLLVTMKPKHTIRARVFRDDTLATFSVVFSDANTQITQPHDVSDLVTWFNNLCSAVPPFKTRLILHLGWIMKYVWREEGTSEITFCPPIYVWMHAIRSKVCGHSYVLVEHFFPELVPICWYNNLLSSGEGFPTRFRSMAVRISAHSPQEH